MIHYPNIDPVALSLGPITIYWYGLTYVGGLVFAWWLGKQRAQLPNSPIKASQIDDLIFYAALGIIAGGRIGYALFMVQGRCSMIHCESFGSGKVACPFTGDSSAL